MTYEYACQACGHTWEAEQSIKDAPLKNCASCGAPKAKRLVSGGTGFLLKGGGWYADGYGSASPSKSSGDSEASGSAGAKPSSDAGSKKAEPSSSDAKAEPSSREAKAEPSAKSSGEASSSRAGTSAAS
jgi:putative FmdB family regulatory protein